ncbi:MAG: neutral/alkaline non-lysosomal ceramidase N-terminal domain-containing protein [Verrucomicrobiales bacterium]|nr:neutral/alkaline non-lysosomal ceramidase N-terminal domain-containing protein [Verrucomicrobiales bacterium]
MKHFKSLGFQLWIPLILLTVLVAVAISRNKAATSQTTAGLARIDMTPHVPVRMVGYASRGYEGAPDKNKLFARALAIGDSNGELRSLMITVELIGVPRSLRDRVFEGLSEKLEISAEQFAISATHTHGGPSLSDYMQETHFCKILPPEEKAHIDEYTDVLVERLITVGIQAAEAREPATLRWGEGRAGFAMNRRFIKNGKWAAMRPNPAGSVDNSVPVLTVTSADADERVLGVFLSYACHCTSYAPPKEGFHGDWAGAAAMTVESRYPDSVALVAAGCGADANPTPRTPDAAPYIVEHGNEIADQVDALLGDHDRTVRLTAPPICQTRTVQLPLASQPGRKDFESWVAGDDDRKAFYGQMWLDRIDNGETVPKEFDYLIQTWQFPGEENQSLTTAFLPGEVTSGYSLRIKSELNTSERHNWVIGYANESPCYVTTEKEIIEGGYEVEKSMVSYDKPSPLAPETEDIIVETVIDLAGGSPDKTGEVIPPRPRPNEEPLTPEEALASMHTKPGLRIELVAAEPLVMDPVAFDWGPDGRLWVVEMRDYPNGLTWNGLDDPLNVPGGRVKVLTDTDGDGRYDKADIFLDNLSYPTGVKVWDKGVLVTAAPNIIYAEDEDGDGQADIQKVWYEGFAKSNQQHRVNGLAWGLDNWLHVANGDGGGVILSKETRDEVDIRGHDLRINPFTKEHEPLSGRTQCGRYRDDWGNWFGCNNSNPLWHYPMRYSLLKRNSAISPPSATVSVPVEPGAAPIYPLSATLERFNQPDRANRFTSVCGPAIYRDSMLGSEFSGNAFMCEPVHNLVSRQVLSPRGATFSSDRAFDEMESEFLASTDTWSRPVSVQTGPDGAIWVADMYRLVIEHPEWIPHEWQEKVDLRGGSELGRIYRIYPEGENPGAIPRLDELSNTELVARLESGNGTVRDMAHQILLWRKAKDAVPALTGLVENGKLPTARLHALSVLDGLGSIDADICRTALSDDHSGVLKNAIRIAAGYLKGEEIIAASGSHLSDPFVAQELAGVLGGFEDDKSVQTLVGIILQHRAEPYVSAIAYSSINSDNIEAVIDTLSLAYTDRGRFQETLADFPSVKPPSNSQVKNISSMASRWESQSGMKKLASTIASVEGPPKVWQISMLIGLLENGAAIEDVSDDEADQKVMRSICKAARSVVGNEKLAEWQRLEAMSLLSSRSVFDATTDIDLFAGSIGPQHSAGIRKAAFEALGKSSDPKVAEAIISRWSSFSPGDRATALKLLSSRSTWTKLLLSGLEENQIPVAQIDATTRQQLTESFDEGIKTRSRDLFHSATNASRAQVLEEYADVLQMEGDATAGRAAFSTTCIACHALEGVGNPIGPDLAAITDRSAEAMLIAILDPNRAVEDKYVNYVIATKDDVHHVGLISEESAGGITLRGGDGSEQKLLRADIASMQSTGISLMPDGLEATLTKQQMADLIAYLGALGGAAEEPESVLSARVAPNKRGIIELRASKCRVSGDRLEFMPDHDALGWWTSERDRAEWTIVLDRPGKFAAELDYSVSPKSAGNQWQLLVNGEQAIKATSESTGGWETYKSISIGELSLTGGDNKIVVRSLGEIDEALFDLRKIRLTPVE